jgi:hypothetical protein
VRSVAIAAAVGQRLRCGQDAGTPGAMSTSAISVPFKESCLISRRGGATHGLAARSAGRGKRRAIRRPPDFA